MAYQNNARRGGKQYSNANRIALWENDRATGERDPQHKGSITELDCPHCGAASDYWVSLWENSNGGGSSPVFSGQIQPKEESSSRSRRPHPSPEYDASGGGPNVRGHRDDRAPVRGGYRSNDRNDSRRDDRHGYGHDADPRDEPPSRQRYDGPDEEIPF